MREHEIRRVIDTADGWQVTVEFDGGEYSVYEYALVDATSIRLSAGYTTECAATRAAHRFAVGAQ